MKRLPPSLTYFALLAIALLSHSSYAAKRNVVMFVVDDQGLHAGCYGDRNARTPNLDSLAREGTRFTHAFCTTASCSASRSVILSGLQNHDNGQYGHQHGYNNFHSRLHVKSLPNLLSQAGYRTARIGKYHLQPESIYQFDEHLRGNQGGSRNPVSMANRCEPWIRSEEEKPFFLYFCTSDPHRGGGYASDLPYQPNYFGNQAAYQGVDERYFDPETLKVPDYLPDTPTCRAELAQYYQSVARIDQGLGRLIAILKSAGVYDDTLILYLSDNGIAFPGAKTTLYDPGMNLPLIVRNPYQPEHGVVTDAMVSWTDLTPTILDFAQVDQAAILPKNHQFHGRSFLSVLNQTKTRGWDHVFASHTFHEITMYYPMRVIRTRDYKYILNLAHQLPFPFASDLYAAPTWQDNLKSGSTHYGRRSIEAYLQRPRHELYALQADPAEIQNLASAKAHQAALTDLQNRLKQFQQETSDPWIVKYQYE